MNRFALQLQCLPTATDRMLVLADLLRRRSEDRRFTVAGLRDAFYSLNVQPPANISALLANLAKRQHVLKHPNDRWALTPKGAEAVEKLGLVVAPSVALSTESDAGAEFAHVDHTVIPTWAAPPRWAAGIARLLDRHPFETNVFCMTRFPSPTSTIDPVLSAISTARDALKPYGLSLHLASDAIIDDDLFGNVGAYMWACRYGLGFLEDRAGRGMNANVVIEVGGMLVTGRRCRVLKDRTAPALPTDLSGHIYRDVDFDDPSTVAEAATQWAQNDLGLVSNS